MAQSLRCVATGSAYEIIWTATQRRNRNFFYFCVASPSKSFCIHFRSRRNAAQILASYYKPALRLYFLQNTCSVLTVIEAAVLYSTSTWDHSTCYCNWECTLICWQKSMSDLNKLPDIVSFYLVYKLEAWAVDCIRFQVVRQTRTELSSFFDQKSWDA